jgi:hypothetical protein
VRTLAVTLTFVLLAAFALPAPSIAQVPAAPTITSISPNSVVAGQRIVGSGPLEVVVTGTGFNPRMTARLADGQQLRIEFVSATQVHVYLPDPLLQTVVRRTIILESTPIANASVFFNVVASAPAPTATTPPPVAVGNPKPVLTSVTPSTLTPSGTTANLTVNGTNFLPTSVVAVGGVNLPTSWGQNIQLFAVLTSPYPAGNVNVTVTNPGPGGGTSNAIAITINSTLPTISGVSPSGAAAGQTITITGTAFGTTPIVRVNGQPIPTTLVSATQLTVVIPTSAPFGPVSIAVMNQQSGITSAAFSYVIGLPH